ncbi:MAG: SOSS complex subunit B family protein [archaeon]
MKISELTIGQGNVEVEGTLKEIGETRTFNKFGKELKVANAILKDDSGTIKLTLWNDDVARFNNGDKVKVVNGYVNEFQGEKQLTSGKFGSLEKVGKGESNGDAEEDETEEEEATDEQESENTDEEPKSSTDF